MQLNIVVAIQDNSNYGDDLLFLAGIRLLNLYYKKQNVRYFVKSTRLSEMTIDAKRLIQSVPFVACICEHELAQLEGGYLSIHLGGTIFSSQYNLKSKLSYLFRDMFLSSKVSLPSLYMSLGVDRKLVRKRFFRACMGSCNYMAVRDYSSFVAVSELTGRYDAYVIPDSVFSFPFHELTGGGETDPLKFDHVNIVRYWPFSEIIRPDVYYRVDMRRCAGVGFCITDKFENKTINQLVTIYDGTLKGMIDITNMLSRAKCIVTERYHGVIAAMALGVPVIGNCIDGKIKNLAIDLDAILLSENFYLFLPGMKPSAQKVERQYLNYLELTMK
ncbi:polysaccharide pyruvyl transferase family protein [Candidatus Peregrinibacteria bacterium]|nr:polysaccharide pyruvyl transferase family protein [bacterium]NCS66788.1 polysaccharide pyruvyl transferase family protein [Candidatus Peregrinibacteria bacterium]